MTTKVQKRMLGTNIKKFQFYKMDFPLTKRRTQGFIWLENGLVIRIEGSRFIIYRKNFPNQKGFIGKSMKTYWQIKRMIAIWFKPYRKVSQNQHLAA